MLGHLPIVNHHNPNDEVHKEQIQSSKFIRHYTKPNNNSTLAIIYKNQKHQIKNINNITIYSLQITYKHTSYYNNNNP